MKPNHYLTILALLNALTFSVAQGAAQAAQAKGGSSHRGGQASTHMSSKGQTNTNAQWSADPERGWIRAQERHELHDAHQSKGKQAGGRHKGNAFSKGGKK